MLINLSIVKFILSLDEIFLSEINQDRFVSIFLMPIYNILYKYILIIAYFPKTLCFNRKLGHTINSSYSIVMYDNYKYADK